MPTSDKPGLDFESAFERIQGLSDKPFAMLAELKKVVASVSEHFTPTDLEQSLKYLRGTVAILRKDTETCYAGYLKAAEACIASTKGGGPVDPGAHEELLFWCRQTVRTFFAEVEGATYAMKRVALWAHERGECDLTGGEVAVLRDEGYRFNAKKRRVEVRSGQYTRTGDSVVLAFTYLEGILHSPAGLDLSTDGWDCFQKLLDLRHTLTHPKEVMSLVVEVEVLLRVLPTARAWFYQSLDALLPSARGPGSV